jgi:hypothetical protein
MVLVFGMSWGHAFELETFVGSMVLFEQASTQIFPSSDSSSMESLVLERRLLVTKDTMVM